MNLLLKMMCREWRFPALENKPHGNQDEAAVAYALLLTTWTTWHLEALSLCYEQHGSQGRVGDALWLSEDGHWGRPHLCAWTSAWCAGSREPRLCSHLMKAKGMSIEIVTAKNEKKRIHTGDGTA